MSAAPSWWYATLGAALLGLGFALALVGWLFLRDSHPDPRVVTASYQCFLTDGSTRIIGTIRYEQNGPQVSTAEVDRLLQEEVVKLRKQYAGVPDHLILQSVMVLKP